MNTQFRKGAIEMCILALIDHRDRYGYELVQAIAVYMEINEGTVYPILRRLEMAKEVASYSVEHSGRLRRYYRITEAGQKRLRDFRLQIGQIQTALSYIQGNGSPKEDPAGREEP